MRKNLLLLAALGLFSCNKNQISGNVPSCIEQKIRQLSAEVKRNPPAEIYSYQYEGRKVYHIPPACCDQYGDLIDEDCRVICHPDGGLMGRGDGQCPDFFTKATQKTLVWQDPRK